MSRLNLFFIILLVVTLTGFGVSAEHYRANAVRYKMQRDDAQSQLVLATTAMSQMQRQQREVASLDRRYIGELRDAKTEIEMLRRDVVTGRKRLQLSATCPADASAGASRLDDGSRPRLTNAAEQDYFRLRDGIATLTKQVEGLQEYIRMQCLR